MSLPSSKREASKSQKFLRSKSAQMRKKMSFTKEGANQVSINTILEQTLKSANQTILSQQGNYRQSMFTASKYVEEGQSNIQSGNWNKGENFCWQITKIEEKRKIKGIKAKFTWCSSKESMSITARVILTDNYNRMNQPEYFIELDSASVDISLGQQKSIQKQINKLIEDEQSKAEQKNQIFLWLKTALISMHNLFINMKLNQRKKVKEIEFKRFAINKNCILYPCPASITWSPHGMLCLTQNKVGTLSKPIVGSIYSYRNLIQAPYKFERFSKKNNEIDDLKMVEERREEEQQTTEAIFYGWDIKEEINFSVFGKLTEDEATEQNGIVTQNQNEKNEKRILKEQQAHHIGNTHNIPPKLEKIYRRHFSNPSENNQFQFLEKLKIFTVKNQIAQLQDGIMYLIDKIQKHNRAGVIDALLENQFTGYHGAFHKSSKEQPTFESLKYELVTQFLQQKIKSTPQSQHFLYMKSVMIENQFFRLALQKYFRENFAKLKITEVKYESLGTFDNFDEFTAEKALFTLLQELIKAEKNFKDSAQKIKMQYRQKPEKYDDPNYRQKKYAKMIQQNIEMKLFLKGYVKKAGKSFNDSSESLSSLKFLKSQSGIQVDKLPSKNINRGINLNLMPFLVVNKVEFSPLQFNMILTPNQRRNFLETVIPILWIKDRSSEKFEYKQAKRVIIANSKIINFLQKINNIGVLWKKIDGGRKSTFLRTIIREYHKFQKRSEVPLGKIYRAYCQGCTDDFTAYNIEELFRVTRCSRCKYLEGVS